MFTQFHATDYHCHTGLGFINSHQLREIGLTFAFATFSNTAPTAFLVIGCIIFGPVDSLALFLVDGVIFGIADLIVFCIADFIIGRLINGLTLLVVGGLTFFRIFRFILGVNSTDSINFGA